MTISPTLFAGVYTAAFLIAAIPSILENLTSGKLTNLNSTILFSVGLFFNFAGLLLGVLEFSGAAVFAPFAIALALIALVAAGQCPGGIAKFLIALLPWFTITPFLVVVTIGFLTAGGAGLLFNRKIPVAPFLVVASFGTLLFDLVSFTGFSSANII